MKSFRKVFEHQVDRSGSSHAILAADSRNRKAEKILQILNERKNTDNCNLLDIGTGSGHIAARFSESTRAVTSVDVVDERVVKKGFKFKKIVDEHLPFDNETFDVVVSNHVVEHVPDQQAHLNELIRVVKSDGVIYLATPNKYWLSDPHYKLPFLSWLPRTLAGKYLKFVQDKQWDVYPISATRLREYLGGRVEVENALPYFASSREGVDLSSRYVVIAKILRGSPRSIIRVSEYISPTLVFLIHKK